jgi:hypothetical protein
MPFQSQVNQYPAPGVEGQRASTNPIASVDAGPGGLIAGPLGVTVGKFAWVSADGITVTNSGQFPTQPDGFVGRYQQGLITGFLAEESMLIPPGFPVTLSNAGDWWAKNKGPSALARNNALYVSYLDGSVVTAVPAVGSVTATLGSTNTASLGATFTASAHAGDSSRIDVTAVTGLISIGDTLANVTGIAGSQTVVSQDAGGTVGGAGTYVLSGTNTASAVSCTCFGKVVNVTVVSTYISIGDKISHANYPVGATITGQTSGTTGGVGVYTLSAAGTQYVASASAVLTYGYTVAVTAVGAGSFGVGQPVVDATTAGNLTANSVVESQISGVAGSTGIYTLSLPATAYAAGDNLTTTAGIQLTTFLAQSPAAVGELVKISTWGV